MLCDDGYYYYKLAVAPDATTSALFDSYTVGTMPRAQIAAEEGVNTDMHFTLEIATQAISANGINGEVLKDASGNDDWASAWANALGSAPQRRLTSIGFLKRIGVGLTRASCLKG